MHNDNLGLKDCMDNVGLQILYDLVLRLKVLFGLTLIYLPKISMYWYFQSFAFDIDDSTMEYSLEDNQLCVIRSTDF